MVLRLTALGRVTYKGFFVYTGLTVGSLILVSQFVKLFIVSLLSQECIFKKTSDNTALRVYWAGNLRIVNCNSCCSRWYFTFNGAECSTPAAIDGVVYMQYGRGSRYKNLYRPRHLEGVCEKLRKGTVRVGFWVGRCSGVRSADAYTGWYCVPDLRRRNTSTGLKK